MKPFFTQKLNRIMDFLFCMVLLAIMLVPVQSRAAEADGKVVKIGWSETSYSYTDKFGRKTGITYEYLQKIASITGWRYEYVEGTWPQLMQMLINGEIDLLSDVSYTPERAEKILYPTLPMGTEAYYIYVSPNNYDHMSEDAQVFDGKTFAVNSGTVQKTCLEEWAKANGLNITIHEAFNQTTAEIVGMLSDGTADAIVTTDSFGNNPSCLPVCKIGSSDYYLAASKGRSDLIKDLNHALKSIQNEDPFYNQHLYQKYIWSASIGIIFTKDEIDWLSQKDTIRVGYRDNYQPFCYEENGSVSGALKDYLEQASECVEGLHINYEAVAYPTTEDALAALSRGELDAVFPVSMSSYDSELRNIFITSPAMKSEIYALVRTGAKKDIFTDPGTKVVLLDGNVNFDNFVKDYFPDWEISWKSPLSEVYKTVSDGNADCAMVSGYRINTNDRLRRENKLSLLDTGEEMSFSFAVNRNDIVLFSVLDKTVDIIEESAVDTMLSKYTIPETKVAFSDYLRDNLGVALTVALALFTLILFLILNKAHTDKVARDRLALISATELDMLTGLYTRNFFFEYASRMHDEHPDYKMDAIIMNIEQFHVVNALYGWEFGDSVLKALGEEIAMFVGETDGIACRSQADRFDVYCKHTDDYQAIFDRLQARLDDCSPNAAIRLRMGIMPWQKDLDPVQLFDRARAACNMVRGGQRTRLIVFNEDMRIKELLEHRLLNDLRQGIDNNEFVIHYQPKFNIKEDTPRLCSAEALVRWNHHELGLIPPGEFITLFENSGQIGLLDRYVWAESIRQMKEWHDKYGVYVPIAVNLSRIDFYDPDLEKYIDGLVENAGVGSENLHLEVTESAYTEGEDQITETINRFRKKGYHIEMDDFGTGYSSLTMLSHMSIDVLKLDRSFIKNITENSDEKDIRMIELILNIARNLKLVVVAEGVETKTQFDFLKNRGCDIIQGFYFARALPADEFEKEYLR